MNEKEQIVARFFECLNRLREDRKIRGVSTFCRRYDINRRNLWKLQNDMSRDIFRVEWLAFLVKDYGVSANWLLTGQGEVYTLDDMRAKLVNFLQMGVPPFVNV